MLTLLNESIKLQSDLITLAPLQIEHQHDLAAAVEDGKLWELWFTSVPTGDGVLKYIETALQEQAHMKSIPFAVIDNKTQKAIGSTRYCNIDRNNRRLEIGYTWYAASYQKTSVNTQAKLLLLTHAFEQLGVIAVEFRTNWHNHVSRQAISRLGAKQDGVLRNHIIMADGTLRDTVIFSITDQEWPAVKKNLEYKLSRYT
ncbi:MAG: GNAT family N-acetyltransferase [Kangiellaceae bacterium]|nr:GNAT family N-acetyltransferase [Kangiellaceae bacterium]